MYDTLNGVASRGTEAGAAATIDKREDCAGWPYGDRIERGPASVLIAAPERGERATMLRACREARLADTIDLVPTAGAIMDYVRREGEYADQSFSPRPNLILVDAEALEAGGAAALDALAGDPDFADIPVMLLCEAGSAPDEGEGFALGLDGIVIKPRTLEGWLEVATALKESMAEIEAATGELAAWYVIEAGPDGADRLN